MRTIARVGLEGLLTPNIKEYGFNTANFPGNYYNAYDFAVETSPEATSLPTSSYPPIFSTIGAGFQLGNEIAEGTFCEKPSFYPTDSSAVFYPIGTSGSEDSTSASTQGYNIRDFFKGGTPKKASIYSSEKETFANWAKVQVGSEVYTGVTFTFIYSSGNWYWNNTIVSNFSETTGIKVFGVVAENSTITVDLQINQHEDLEETILLTITDTTGIAEKESITTPLPMDKSIPATEAFASSSAYDKDILINYRGGYSTGDTEISNLLKFPLTGEDKVTTINITTTESFLFSLESFDYTYSLDIVKNENLLVLGTDYTLSEKGIIKLTQDVSPGDVIVITQHLHNLWIPSWNATLSKSNISSINNNFLLAEDSLEVAYKNATTAIFCQPIEITEEGWYNFSGYFRLNSSSIDENTYVGGMYFTAGITNLTDVSSDSFAYSDFNREIVEGEYRKFKIGTSWQRISQASYLPAGTHYATIYWPYTSQGASNTLKFMGLCVVKGKKAPVYDYRLIRYTEMPKAAQKKHPLLFNFDTLLTESKWAIGYTRYIFDTTATGDENLDTIGNLSFGYRGGNLCGYLNGVEIPLTARDLETDEPISLTPSYCNYERILVEYEDDEIIVTVLGVSQNYYFTINLNNQFEFDHVLEGVHYKALLGGKFDLTFGKGSYKDLWWFPTGLSTEDTLNDKQKYLYQRLGLTTTFCEDKYNLFNKTVFVCEGLREGSVQ